MDPFEYQKPTEEQIAKIQKLREKCQELNILMQELLPASRERSLAITKLEEVSMWANKAAVFS